MNRPEIVLNILISYYFFLALTVKMCYSKTTDHQGQLRKNIHIPNMYIHMVLLIWNMDR